jgi:hypothetical protein
MLVLNVIEPPTIAPDGPTTQLAPVPSQTLRPTWAANATRVPATSRASTMTSNGCAAAGVAFMTVTASCGSETLIVVELAVPPMLLVALSV